MEKRVKELYFSTKDTPIINYVNFVLYYQLYRETDITFQKVDDIAQTILEFHVNQKTDELTNYLSNLREGYERVCVGVPFLYKAFDCLIKSNTISEILDTDVFYGRELGFDYLITAVYVKEFYERIHDELLSYYGDTMIFYDAVQQLKKEFVELAQQLRLLDTENFADVERFLSEVSALNKPVLKDCKYYKDLIREYEKSYLSVFTQIGLDDLQKQTNTSIASYYGKLVELSRKRE